MTPGYAVIWQGQTLYGFLTKQGTWSPDACEAHVFKTWSAAKTKAREFKTAAVTEAWI